ncbi:MAG: PD-(D/E)XK nuclease family protein [Nanoarchaeota archaeon]
MVKRIESPSSINTFKQCPRKYYYQYIQKLPTLPSIHTLRGNITHSCLEYFYDLNIDSLNEDNFPQKLQEAVQKLLIEQWKKREPELKQLNLNTDQKQFYFEETMLMLMNWASLFVEELKETMEKKNLSLQEAFIYLTPIREQEYISDDYSVHGYIDAVNELEEETQIVDYKTNSSLEIKDELRLQLAIYSLLYFEKHKKMPSKAGIFFLRQRMKWIKVDEELLEFAKREINCVHSHTCCRDKKEDYPYKKGPLCKWSSGQCDFYEICKLNWA